MDSMIMNFYLQRILRWPREQFQEMVLEPPQDVLMQPEAQIPQGQPMMVSHPRSSKYHNRTTSGCRQQDQEADLADNFSG